LGSKSENESFCHDETFNAQQTKYDFLAAKPDLMTSPITWTKWFLSILIGLLLAVITFTMTLVLSLCASWKFGVLSSFAKDGNYAAAYMFNVTVAVVCMLIASGLTAGAPTSAGSGQSTAIDRLAQYTIF
jgi:hypothetical protein